MAETRTQLQPLSGPPEAASETATVIPAGSGSVLLLPDAPWLGHADFAREGGALVITAPDGAQIVVADYFMLDDPPALMTEGGGVMAADLVLHLAGPRAAGQYAQAGDAAPGAEIGAAIGDVTRVEGAVTATHADGSRVALSAGAPVYQGDVLETGDGAAIALVFADGTTFSLGGGARMVLDQMIYDADSGVGQAAMSILEGAFVFVTGAISETDPDAVIVHTPVATIGIRGTTVGGRAGFEGSVNTIALLPDAGGTVGGIYVQTSEAVDLFTPFQAVLATSAFLPPVVTQLTRGEAISLFGDALGVLPELGLSPPPADTAPPPTAPDAAPGDHAGGDGVIHVGGDFGADAGLGSGLVVAGSDAAATPTDAITGTSLFPVDDGNSGDDLLQQETALNASQASTSTPLSTIPNQPPTSPPNPPAPAATNDFIPFTSGDATVLAAAVTAGIAGLAVVGAPTFVGSLNPSASSFSAVDFGAAGGDSFALSEGVLLTTGTGDPALGPATLSVDFGGGGDSNLDSELLALSSSAPTLDTTSLSFDFTVPANTDAIVFRFMFGTDEFPTEPVADIGALFIDGKNILFLDDGAPPRFVDGVNEAAFFDNTSNALTIAYDGITAPAFAATRIDDSLSTHSFKLAIADTDDRLIDSGLFVSGFGFGDNKSAGTSGADTLVGGNGSDTIDGLGGDDLLFGLRGDDALAGSAGADKLFGGRGDDTLDGGAGDDTLDGGAGADTLTAGAGNDRVSGGFGNDTVIAGAGDDVLDGGPGQDSVDFAAATSGVTVDLGAGTATGSASEVGSDTLAGFEDVRGGAGGDTITGAGGAETLVGRGGADTLTGAAGADRFAYIAPGDGGLVSANVSASSQGVNGDTVTDFLSGTDKFVFERAAFGNLAQGTLDPSNFATIAGPYDGTNSGLAGGSTAFVFSTADQILSFDPAVGSGAGDAGYTVIATVQAGAVVTNADIEIAANV